MNDTYPLRAVVGCALALLPLALHADEVDTSAARFDALYTSELWHNAHGGLRTGTKQLGDLDVALKVDGERAWGLDGVTLFANGLFIHGGSLGGQYIGEAQTVSNIEALHQARLFELWVEKRFGANENDDSLRVGLYDLNSEFDVSETAALFVNSSHGISPQIAQTGRNGPSIFPVTSFGARWHWALGPAWSAQFVALDGVPGDPKRPASNAIRFDEGDGVLLASEIARQGGRSKKVAVGAWYYTARFDAVETGERCRGNQGVYALVDAQLFTERDDEKQGLAGFVRAGTADSRVNRFAHFVGAGVVYTGALPRRSEDQLGLGVATVGNGGAYRRASERDGLATHRRETALELTYRFAVASWLTLQADLQHIINPDTNPFIEDATAIGLRFELTTTKRL